MKKQRLLRLISVFLSVNIIFQIVAPTAVWALSGGPSQPEVQSFEPVGTTEMVDLTTGDFNYNIPLLDVEGYPINIAYHSGVNMEQEASWVGLGWNINAGVINRNMRGLPDDFNGESDQVQKYEYTRPNVTIGVNTSAHKEFFGLRPPIGSNYGLFYNNYKGLGTEVSLGLDYSIGGVFHLGGAITSNSQDGISISYSRGVSLGVGLGKTGLSVAFGLGSSTSINARTGLKTTSVSPSLSVNKLLKDSRGNSYSSSLGHSMGGSYVSYGYGTNIPSTTSSFTGSNAMFSVAPGVKLPIGIDIGLNVSGYYTEQQCKNNDFVSYPAYGYLNAHNRIGDVSLSDYVKEKEGVYSKSNPYLPVINHTFDIHTISGQGIGGMFRAYRTDMGMVSNNYASSSSIGGSGGLEFAIGNIFKLGANINIVYTESKSGEWNNSALKDKIGFTGSNNALYPTPYYFKQTGEKTRVNTTFFPNKNLNDVLRPALAKYNPTFLADVDLGVMVKNDGDEASGTSKVDLTGTNRGGKDAINQNINVVTAGNATHCLDKHVFNVPLNTTPDDYLFSINRYSWNVLRIDDSRKSNHITEISTVAAGGARYVYSLPAYNHSQREISFTTDDDAKNCDDGTVNYNPSIIADKKGKMASGEGYDGYYSETKLPAYAHSYLLTSVISPDYVDLGAPGFDDEDLGTYTKINYTKTTGGNNNTSNIQGNYNWRAPHTIQSNTAQHNKLLYADEFDDKGSIIYGEKEVWYMHSVESKNFIAVFHISTRGDGKGAIDINGGVSSSTSNLSYKLDRIVLYNKQDLKANGTADATPIKEILFAYDYTLMPGVYNGTSGNGKLTLKSIAFKYGKSNKGLLSRYEFTYDNPSAVYAPKFIDRWGTPSGLSSGCDEFPYTQQNKALADANASKWNLKSIKLPSGGTITVDYESDDYAYVQDKKAMMMCKVAGFSQDGSSNKSNFLYTDDDANNWVHVVLLQSCPSVEEFINRYLPDSKNSSDLTRYLYFNFYTKIRHNLDKYEYVRGYVEIDYQSDGSNTVKRLTNHEYAIKVKAVTSEDDANDSYDPDASPFAKAAWQYFRLVLPQHAFPGSNKMKESNFDMYALLGFIGKLRELVIGVNDRLLKSRYADQVDLERSIIRLKQGTGFKYGGGLRVKRIEINDNWGFMSVGGSGGTSYGQEYEYVTEEQGRIISSGVASYEPAIGNDENPFKQPVFTDKKNVLIPDDKFYAEEPFGESLFPSPSITYSKVKVRNITPASANVKKHGTGYVVNEYYTTKDFPTITQRTPIKSEEIKPALGLLIKNFFKLNVRNNVTLSQGYQIELNDMDGKLKSESVYSEPVGGLTAKLIKRKEYFYKTDADNPKKLNNYVSVINPDGQLEENVLLGVESDMVFETNYQNNKMYNPGLQANMLAEAIGFIPAFFPIPIPSYREENSKYGTVSSTRVIYRFGILERTVVWEDNATITQTNLAFDPFTGEVLYSKVTNEFKDPLYNITYPAHWAYNGMGQASTTEGLTFQATIEEKNTNITNVRGYQIIPVTADNFNFYESIHLNDLLAITVNNNEYLFNYVQYEDQAWNVEPIIASPTLSGAQECTIRVIRSGRDNNPSAPIFSATTLLPPLPNVMALSPSHQIVQASGAEYHNLWQINCKQQQITYPYTRAYNTPEFISFLDYFFKSNDQPEELQGDYIRKIGYKNISSLNEAFNNIRTNTFFVKGTTENGEPAGEFYIERTVDNTITPAKVKRMFRLYRTSFMFNLIHDYDNTCHNKFPVAISLVTDNSSIVNGKLKGSLTVSLDYGPGCSATQAVIDFDNISYNDLPHINNSFIGELLCVNLLPEDHYKYYGNWRKKKDYVYYANRTPQNATATNQRKDGVFSDFNPLYVQPTGATTIEKYVVTNNLSSWKWTNNITRYNKFGNPIEAKDLLNNFSSVLYTDDGLVSLNANNARLKEVGFETFERPILGEQACYGRHWYFPNHTIDGGRIDTGFSHTGRNSFFVDGYITYNTRNSYTVTLCNDLNVNETAGTGIPFVEDCPNCNTNFAPIKGKTYVITGWVSVNKTGIVSRADINATVRVELGGTVVNIKPKGPIIEGWQRFTGEFTIPENANTVNVELTPSVVDGVKIRTWYDDIRIQPKGALLKSYVYNIYNNRLMAELDENNFATFYEYDEQGALKRIKKETEKGVMTVREVRNHNSN